MEQQQKATPEIKNIAQFLRSGGSGLKVRVGALNGKRLDYFKGLNEQRITTSDLILTYRFQENLRSKPFSHQHMPNSKMCQK
jgi:hypothetical protein